MADEESVRYVVRWKPSTGEWVVVAHDSNNKRIEACCYYTNDERDAEATRIDMQKRSDAARRLKFRDNLGTLIMQKGYTSSSSTMLETFVVDNRVKLLELLKGYPC
jgi:hypothetical protein